MGTTNEHEYTRITLERGSASGGGLRDGSLNMLGHGLLEKPYENALVVEFGLQNILYRQQPRFDVHYKEVTVGEYIPDLICFGELVIDTKSIEKL